MLLGCIADDFTGATDLANNLVRHGMRVIQTIGVPEQPLSLIAPEGIDAVVVALKSRTIPAAQAIDESLAALRWLQAQGARQIYFKYCSTFDSTPAGNIGPVTEALMQALGIDFTIATPAFPDNGRTVFKGHLFVGDGLLSDSGMRDHPLTPMTDAHLVRVLQAQCKGRVGLIDYRTVAAGAAAVEARIQALREQGQSIAIVDAISNEDLFVIGEAIRTLPLVTAGSGVAIGLPRNFGLQPSSEAARLPAASGRQAIVAGSCSQATQAQVADFRARGGACHEINPLALAAGDEAIQREVNLALEWARSQWQRQEQQGVQGRDQRDGNGPELHAAGPGRNTITPVLISSTNTPEAVRLVQQQLGVARAGALVEQALALICSGLVQAGARQLVMAGGETSGACVQALGIPSLRIGAQIDPGVPWCHARTTDGTALHLALKSGNFGGPSFFSRSFDVLHDTASSS